MDSFLRFLLLALGVVAALRFIQIAVLWAKLMAQRMVHVASVPSDTLEPPEGLGEVFLAASADLLPLGFVLSHASWSTEKWSGRKIYEHVYVHHEARCFAVVKSRQIFLIPTPYQVVFITTLTDERVLFTTDWERDSSLEYPPGYVSSDGYFGDILAQWVLHREAVKEACSDAAAHPVAPSEKEYYRGEEQFLKKSTEFWGERYFSKESDGRFRYRVIPALKMAWKLTWPPRRRTAPAVFSAARKERVPAHVQADVHLFEELLLQEPRTPARGGWKKLLLLAGSMAVFGVLYGVTYAWESAAWVALVLLIHELGHLAAMKWYGYEDTSIYFIPFFGAITIGRQRLDEVRPLQQLIIYLLGPVPGILIGLVMLSYTVATGDASWQSAGGWFLILNYLNLLPVLPLDGGRIVDALVRRKFPFAPFVLFALSSLLMALAAIALGSLPLGILAGVLILSLPTSWRTAKAVRMLQRELPATGDKKELIRSIVAWSYREHVDEDRPGNRANTVKALFTHMSAPPVSNRDAIRGTALYLGSLVLPLAGAALVGFSLLISRYPSDITPADWDERIAKAGSGEDRCSEMLKAGDWYAYDEEDPDLAKHYYRKVVALAESLNMLIEAPIEAHQQLAWLSEDSIEARFHHHTALVLAEQLHGARHERVADILEQQSIEAAGFFSTAERRQSLERAMAIRIAGGDSINASHVMQSLAALHARMGNLAAAEPLLTEALALVDTIHTAWHLISPAVHLLADVQERAGKVQEAMALLYAWETRAAVLGDDFTAFYGTEFSSHRGWIALHKKDTALAREVFSSASSAVMNLNEDPMGGYFQVKIVLDLASLEVQQGRLDSARRVADWIRSRGYMHILKGMYGIGRDSVQTPGGESAEEWENERRKAHIDALVRLFPSGSARTDP